MMNRKKITATLTAILCAASTLAAFPAMSAQASQAVYNDFEVTYNGWHGITKDAQLVPSEGVNGSRGLKVTGRTSAEDGAASSKGFYLWGGVKYTYNVKVQAQTDETFHMSVLTIDQNTGEETVKELTTQQVKAGEWAELTANYKAPANSYEFEVRITTDSTADFTIDDCIITTKESTLDLTASAAEQGLKDEFGGYFRVGNILNGGTVQNSGITANILKDCTAIECENETKPDATLNRNGCSGTNIAVSLNSCSAIADFAAQNGLGFRGHTFVWHSQTPGWFFKTNFDPNGAWVDKNTMDARMESYIKNMFDAFATQYPTLDLYSYDVCNECVSDDSNRTANYGGAREAGDSSVQGQGGKSAWVQVYGDNSFVEKAFTYARKYAPAGCELYYNDYNEYWDHKENCIYNMCKSLYEKGLLDGVGMQSHIDAGVNSFSGTNAYLSAMKKYLSIGCNVQITELDISLLDNNSPKYSSDDQAAKYAAIFQAAVDWNKNPQSDGRVTLVQIWGPNDANSWLKSGSDALLYDKNNQPKAAYNKLMQLLPADEWGGASTTVQEPVVDEDGYWFNIDFEKGASGFSGRGAATAAVSTSEHYSGSNSLYVSGRTAEWNGAQMSLNSRIFKPGETFSFSTNVKFTDGAATDKFYLSLQYTDADGKTKYDHIAEATGVKGEWVQLLNTTYTIPKGSGHILYVEMPESTADFYMDDVIASVAGKAIPGAGEADVPVVVNPVKNRTSALQGDVNGDGVIDVFDLAAAKRGILNGFANKYDEQSADCDGNGAAEVNDLVYLTKWLHGQLTDFPEPATPPEPETPAYDNSKWDNYQETASADYINFYQSSIKNMGNTYRLTQKLAAAEAGEPLTVAYLGGSITEGKNYTTPFSNYLKQTFAKGDFTEVNAGMSGTSSVVGLVRSEVAVVSKQPDIIFIEFSVNDHEDILYKQAFESVIKKFLELPNAPAVGIIINRSKGGFSTQNQMYPIGKNFDIPVISMDDALTGAFNSGFLQPGDYFTDEYHPHQQGGQLVADCLSYYVRQALKTENQSTSYELPSSYVHGAPYSSCKNVDPKDMTGFNAGSWAASKGYGTLPFGYDCNGSSPMTFKTKGKGLIIVFKANGSGMGEITVNCNGTATKISGNKLYTWGGPDAELGYYQETSGDLDVSITGSGSFTIWGVGVVE